MKNNKANFISSSLETLLLAIVIGLLTFMAAKSEPSLDLNSLNRLFTPTQSERFFQAGRKDFEQEIKIFTNPEQYWRDDLLEIDPGDRDCLDLNLEIPDSQFNDTDGQIRILEN